MRTIICPNSKCHRKIEEPILLNNFSTIPAEHYYACPHCFTKLNAYAHIHTNLVGLFLAAFGLIVLACVGYLTWYDITMGINGFFGPTGEAILQPSIGQLIFILFGGILFFVVVYGVLGVREAKRVYL